MSQIVISNDISYLWFSDCYSSSLIKCYCFHISQRLDCLTTSDQYTIFCSQTATNHQSCWSTQAQCAGTGYDQNSSCRNESQGKIREVWINPREKGSPP